MSPPDSSVYAGYLFELGLVGEVERDTMLDMEKDMKYYVSQNNWYSAWQQWNNEFGYFLGAMGCNYYYGVDLCTTPPEEDNYEKFIQSANTR